MSREPQTPFLPNLIMGMNTSHVKTIALIGYSDHVNDREIAVSQIAHTAIPMKRSRLNAPVKMICIDLDLSSETWACS